MCLRVCAARVPQAGDLSDEGVVDWGLGGGWIRALSVLIPCLDRPPAPKQGTCGASSAASGPVLPGRGTVFSVLQNSLEVWRRRASAGLLRRLQFKDFGERGGLSCLDGPCGGGGQAVPVAEAVCPAAAKIVRVPGLQPRRRCCGRSLSHLSSGSCALQAGWPGPASSWEVLSPIDFRWGGVKVVFNVAGIRVSRLFILHPPQKDKAVRPKGQ